MSKELERIELSLYLLKEMIQPTIYKGFKKDIYTLKKDFEKINRLEFAKKQWNFTFEMQELYEFVMFGNIIIGNIKLENPPKQNPTKPTHKPIKIGKER